MLPGSSAGGRRVRPALGALALLACAAATAWAGPGMVPAGFEDRAVATGLNQPVALAFLPDGRALFVEYKTPRIGLIVNGAVASPDPSAWLPGVRVDGWERGLLAIAVDPGWPARPYVYVLASDSAAQTSRVSRYTMGGDVAFTGGGGLSLQVASRHDLVADIPDQAMEHNGGALRFGPDGRLYASIGDDLAFCDAQVLGILRGKILRLDVSRLPAGPGSASRALVTPPDNPYVGHHDPDARLVWAHGLRNPFRFAIDPLDGALFVADVGDESYEELDRIPGGGANFGWPAYEGLASYLPSCPAAGAVAPIYAYPTAGQSAAMTGVAVYRHWDAAPHPFPTDYRGHVFVSDLYAGFLRRLRFDGTSWAVAPPAPGQPAPGDWGRGFEWVVDWQQGPDGALWYVRMVSGGSFSGEIRRIVPLPTVADTGPDGRTRAAALALEPPRPQPARDEVELSWTQEGDGTARLSLHALDGRRVASLGAPAAGAGRHTVRWQARDDAGRALTPGVYFAVLACDGRRVTRRVLIAR
jgi:glucose/arabinose dehydrogenase